MHCDNAGAAFLNIALYDQNICSDRVRTERSQLQNSQAVCHNILLKNLKLCANKQEFISRTVGAIFGDIAPDLFAKNACMLPSE